MNDYKKIELRKYYAIRVELLSPLNVSSGRDYYTDSDMLRNGSGDLFVPGTSLAGAFRNNLGIKKGEQGIMGYSKEQKGRMSSLYISDLYFDGKPKVSVRDSVALTAEKTVDNKFDMEIIETGAQGTIFFSYLLREGEKQQEFEDAINTILQDIQSGAVRLGANKNRGFGRIKIKEIYQRTFQAENIEEWIRFLKNPKTIENYRDEKQQDYSYDAWVKDKKKPQEKYIKIRVPLILTGGISIRRYSNQPDQADYEHITCNGKPVVPGTSWNGAIRADAREILNSLGCSNADAVLKHWFGNVDTNRGRQSDREDSMQSQIVIGESEIRDAVRMTMTRNKVNRFDASTKDGALYSEISYFGGKTWLEILVRKDEKKEYLALLGMLKLVIADIQKGYVAVGGQTAIGRGIFKEDMEQSAEYSEEISEELCMSALYSVIA